MKKKIICLFMTALLLASSACGDKNPVPVQTDSDAASSAEPAVIQYEGAGPEASDAGTEAGGNSENTGEGQASPADPGEAPTEDAVMPSGGSGTASAQPGGNAEEQDPAASIKSKVTAYEMQDRNETEIRLNAQGEVITDKYEWRELTDVLTGKPSFYTCLRYERLQERNRFGDFKETAYSRLYSLDGEMLSDWENWVYPQSCGGLVLRRPYVEMWGPETENEGGLWNPITDEQTIDEVTMMAKVNDDSVLCYGDGHTLLCTVDKDGKRSAEVPEGLTLRSGATMNGVISSEKMYGEEDSRSVLLNDRFEILVETTEDKWITFDDGAYREGHVAAYGFETGTIVYAAPDYRSVYETEEHISYFDGERVIVDSEENMRLETLEGQVLAGPYGNLMPLSDTGVSERFLAVNNQQTEAYVIDREGKVVSSYDGPEFRHMQASHGLIVRTSPAGGPDEWEAYESLLDQDFKEIIPLSRHYNTLYPENGADDSNPIIWVCSKYPTYNGNHIDLYDEAGEMIFEDASLLGAPDGKAIPVAKGHYIGLIDYNGKWIKRNSRFTLDVDD